MSITDQYLNRQSAINAVSNLLNFASDISETYVRHGIDFSTDVGRQNILLSAAQEHFFANEIRDVVGDCRNDGRTGEPDIIIDSLGGKEVECKVVCKGKQGSWHLQADRTCLGVDGKSLDFLYLLFDRTYDNVGVLLFKDLTFDDYKKPSPGSRGKSRMNKSTAFKKCIPLIGGFFDKRERYLQKYADDISNAQTDYELKVAKEKLELWEGKPSQISIVLESIDELTR
tara:strand:+ start:4430 stop:5113 length:684 start_codon:yes stop_codon:yes gene_type:complete